MAGLDQLYGQRTVAPAIVDPAIGIPFPRIFICPFILFYTVGLARMQSAGDDGQTTETIPQGATIVHDLLKGKGQLATFRVFQFVRVYSIPLVQRLVNFALVRDHVVFLLVESERAAF